jgi:hypothetical protein
VSGTRAYVTARDGNSLLPVPSGDGVALLFFADVAGPADCAREISVKLGSDPSLRLRMGIHSGLVQRQPDISGRENVVGEGINTAQRVMSLAGEGQILVTAQYADWLGQFEGWAPYLHPLGETAVKHGNHLRVFNLYDHSFGSPTRPTWAAQAPKAVGSTSLKVVLLYKRKSEPDETLLRFLEAELGELGHEVFIDRHLRIGIEWAKAIESQIRAADAVIVLVSDKAAGSEMLEYEIETAEDEFRKRGKPTLLPIRLGSDKPLEGAIGSVINRFHFTVWGGPEHNHKVLTEISSALTEPPSIETTQPQLEPAGGAVLPDSPFYITRPTDAEYLEAIRNRESIVLIKGSRQIGKTSLIGRGTRLVKDLGYRHALTDFQKLSTTQLEQEESFYKLLAATLARQLGFRYDFATEWVDVFGPNMNMDNFVRALVDANPTPLIWFMDEADKLFPAPFASDFFGLLRSWHNARATEPDGPWGRLMLVIAYATEAHLFIKDLNQSPFNVGRHLELQPFTLEQLRELNARYGSPLRDEEQLSALHRLIGGQPFLSRRSLDVLCQGSMTFAELVAASTRDDGPFGDHLKRMLIAVSQLPEVTKALVASLTDPRMPESDGVQRLRAAGVLRQTETGSMVLCCELYERYLGRHLLEK